MRRMGGRDRQSFNARLRDHLHRPHRGRTHVHRRPKISVDVPRFWGAEPISFTLVDHMVQTPGCAVSLVPHAFAEQERGESKAGSYPHFRRLFVSRRIEPSAAMPLAAPISPPPNFMTLKS